MIFALIYPIQCLHHAAKSFPMLNPFSWIIYIRCVSVFNRCAEWIIGGSHNGKSLVRADGLVAGSSVAIAKFYIIKDMRYSFHEFLF